MNQQSFGYLSIENITKPYNLTVGCFTIGTRLDCDVRILSKKNEKAVCELKVAPDGLSKIRVKIGKNHICLNNNPLEKEKILVDKDEIKICDKIIQYINEAPLKKMGQLKKRQTISINLRNKVPTKSRISTRRLSSNICTRRPKVDSSWQDKSFIEETPSGHLSPLKRNNLTLPTNATWSSLIRRSTIRRGSLSNWENTSDINKTPNKNQTITTFNTSRQSFTRRSLHFNDKSDMSEMIDSPKISVVPVDLENSYMTPDNNISVVEINTSQNDILPMTPKVGSFKKERKSDVSQSCPTSKSTRFTVRKSLARHMSLRRSTRIRSSSRKSNVRESLTTASRRADRVRKLSETPKLQKDVDIVESEISIIDGSNKKLSSIESENAFVENSSKSQEEILSKSLTLPKRPRRSLSTMKNRLSIQSSSEIVLNSSLKIPIVHLTAYDSIVQSFQDHKIDDQKTSKIAKVQKSPNNDLSKIYGVRKLFRTPILQKSPHNDLREVNGVKKLLKSPKEQKSPRNNLTKIVGIKKLFRSPKLQKLPKNDLTNVNGVKRLLRTPKEQKPPKNDLTDIRGVKTLFKQKKIQKSPNNDLTNIVGTKKLFSTPKEQKPPKNDLTNIRGVKSLFKEKKIQKLPKNDLNDVKGVKKMFRTPKVQESPNNNLTNIIGTKKLFSTPKEQKSPKNDLTNVQGIKKILKTPKTKNSPLNDLRNVSGLPQLFEPMENVPNLSGTPVLSFLPKHSSTIIDDEKKSTSSKNGSDVLGVERATDKSPTKNLSNISNLNPEFNESDDPFDKLLDKPVLKQYRHKSLPSHSPKLGNIRYNSLGGTPTINPEVIKWLDEHAELMRNNTMNPNIETKSNKHELEDEECVDVKPISKRKRIEIQTEENVDEHLDTASVQNNTRRRGRKKKVVDDDNQRVTRSRKPKVVEEIVERETRSKKRVKSQSDKSIKESPTRSKKQKVTKTSKNKEPVAVDVDEDINVSPKPQIWKNKILDKLTQFSGGRVTRSRVNALIDKQEPDAEIVTLSPPHTTPQQPKQTRRKVVKEVESTKCNNEFGESPSYNLRKRNIRKNKENEQPKEKDETIKTDTNVEVSRGREKRKRKILTLSDISQL